jgi:calcium-dependent protein kinase
MVVLVKFLDIDHLKELRNMFFAMDTNRSGTLTIEEVQHALNQAGFSDTRNEVETIVRNLGDGIDAEIHYTDFLAATISSKMDITEEHLWSVFRHFDVDDSGYISADNLAQIFKRAGKDFTAEEI